MLTSCVVEVCSSPRVRSKATDRTGTFSSVSAGIWESAETTEHTTPIDKKHSKCLRVIPAMCFGFSRYWFAILRNSWVGQSPCSQSKQLELSSRQRLLMNIVIGTYYSSIVTTTKIFMYYYYYFIIFSSLPSPHSHHVHTLSSFKYRCVGHQQY